ncbi:hypothetical protein POM88_042488 [Heracleum sosnowskyi]|uniref:Uncharacterized protein n=1 Tax=Heracleum sosnowskyi TaxID=360622 RepID=A0AAD8HIP4_9APIA|nr:hypothetical protein POM88_042488 [Heracleum sosnowskyi]
MKTTSNQKKLIKIITMPIRVLNKGKDMYVRSMMNVAQKPRYGSSNNMMRSARKGQGSVADRGLSKSLSTSATTSRSSSYRNDDLRDFIRAHSTSNMGFEIDFYLEQLIKEEQMKKLKELMERNNFSKSKSLRGPSKSYSIVAMGRIDEEGEVEEVSTSNGVKKIEGFHSRSKSLPFRKTSSNIGAF